MLYLVRLAARNALRNRRRSLLTLIAILLGVAIYVFAQGMVEGIEKTMISMEVNTEHAHLRVMTAAYVADEDFHPLEEAVVAAPVVEALLAKEFPGALVGHRAAFTAVLGDGKRKMSVRGLAIDPVSYVKMFSIGELPVPAGATPSGYAWPGVSVAEAFGWKVGDRMTIEAKTKAGTRNALLDVEIAGLISVGHPVVDAFTVFIPLSTARELLAIDDAYANEVQARFESADDAERAKALIAKHHPKLVAQTWRQKTEYVIALNAMRRGMFQILTAIILLIGAVGVANTTLMSGLERSSEVGTLLALGYPRHKLLLLFLVEAALIGLVGTLLGLLLGGGGSYHLEQVGLHLPVPADEAAAMPVPTMLYFHLQSSALWIGATMGMGVAIVAALYPAWRLSRVDPIDALRMED